ncbi:hypothetical protein PU634_14690 [Oceanimonas pelagia]|uniref:Uncharacterized protein n=1 Tax=Oceanimonas pelagia TaxID=3028314 RepID=A0AA50KNG4_9GAMM|nr:hypothetical protein [Oceanimonas pelagia]WMC10308.1 hypothetical protein PU634_14690 [Oceanimonas pelagia]
MLIRRCSYTLMDAHPVKAHMVLHPTGSLEVEVAERQQHFTVDFDRVQFRRGERGMVLICEDVAGAPVCLSLNSRDAFELYHLMENSREELEELMCDLA